MPVRDRVPATAERLLAEKIPNDGDEGDPLTLRRQRRAPRPSCPRTGFDQELSSSRATCGGREPFQRRQDRSPSLALPRARIEVQGPREGPVTAEASRLGTREERLGKKMR